MWNALPAVLYHASTLFQKEAYGKRSLYYRGTILWNALPAVLYHASTLFQFRSSYLEQYNCS